MTPKSMAAALLVSAIAMTDRQKVPYGVELLDEDEQPITDPAELEGIVVTFTSSDPSVADVRPIDIGDGTVDPLNVYIGSGKVGKATITAHVDGFTQPNGDPVPDETLEVTVTNSAPGRLNARVGVPIDE